MAENSSIEWTDHTFNPWRGCTMVSPGCAHCYAAREAVRFPNIRGIWGDSGTRIVAVPSAWKEPLKWNRKAERANAAWHDCAVIALSDGDQAPDAPARPRVFCASLADVFEDWQGELRFPADIAPDGFVRARWDGEQLVREFEDSAEAQGLPLATMDNARRELFRLIQQTPHLDWLLLTKRPENVMRMIPPHWEDGFPPNVWMGTTVENQDMANQRISILLKIPASVRFLSCEPLLGPVKLWPDCFTLREGKKLWVIAGGESGPKARPMHPDWARSIRDQCQRAGVPFLFKQWGEWAPKEETWPDNATIRQFDNPACAGQLVRWETACCSDKKQVGKVTWNAHDETGRVTRLDHVGKRVAGRLLDGRTWDEFPRATVATAGRPATSTEGILAQ